MKLYPWLEPYWGRLQGAIREARLPHALLISGPAGVGKRVLAMALARRVLCLQPDNENACGVCQSCQLFAAGTHADLQLIETLDDSKVIKVDQIRELIERNSLTPHIANIKVHLLQDVHLMNTNAANSLLKTLEEPSTNSLLILLTDRPENLTATIRSRCQQIQIATPDTSQSLSWLEQQNIPGQAALLLSLAQGAPLKALAMADDGQLALRKQVFTEFGKVIFNKLDPVQVATDWQSHDKALLIIWLINWTVDMMRIKFGIDSQNIDNKDFAAGLKKIAGHKSHQQLFELYASLLESGRLLNTQVNANLLLESLLLNWVHKDGNN